MIRRAASFIVVIALVCVGIPLVGAGERSLAAATVMAGRVHANFQPNTGKIFALVIGNDARSGNPDNARADAIHIVGINTETMKGGILNFPRDSWVEIPGYGGSKINEAIVAGGPQRLAQTLEKLTGIRLDYWVMTGFEGFSGLIKSVGAIPYEINQDIYDPSGSGAAIEAGTKFLGAAGALAYVRTRHNFGGGDVDRTTNQGSFMKAMLGRFVSKTAADPSTLFRWMSATERNTRFDVPPDEMFRLAVLASQLDPKDVGNVTVPVSLGSMGAASVVFISDAAKGIYKRFKKNGSLKN